MTFIGVGTGKFKGVRKIFAGIFPNFCPKSFLCDFAYTFSPTNLMKAFLGVTSCVFLRTLGAILPRFSANQNFSSCTPVSYTTDEIAWKINTSNRKSQNEPKLGQVFSDGVSALPQYLLVKSYIS